MFMCLSVTIVTMLSQRLLRSTAECPTDRLFPSDRGNPADPRLPSDPHLRPTERCGEPGPGWRRDGDMVNLTAYRLS